MPADDDEEDEDEEGDEDEGPCFCYWLLSPRPLSACAPRLITSAHCPLPRKYVLRVSSASLPASKNLPQRSHALSAEEGDEDEEEDEEEGGEPEPKRRR